MTLPSRSTSPGLLAAALALACAAPGCSALFDADDFRGPFAHDASVVDANVPTDGPPSDVNRREPRLLSLQPSSLHEGVGSAEGARAVPLVVVTDNLAADAVITVAATPPGDGGDAGVGDAGASADAGADLDAGLEEPELPLILGDWQISVAVQHAATSVRIPVLEELGAGQTITLYVYATQDDGTGQLVTTDPLELTIIGLDERTFSNETLTFEDVAPLYSRVTIAGRLTLRGAQAVRLVATESIAVAEPICANGQSNRTPGAGGCSGGAAQAPGTCGMGGGGAGGSGGLLNGSGGGGGGHATAGTGGTGNGAGGAGGITGNDMLVPLVPDPGAEGSRGNGGGGGAGSALGGSGGVGGGGGGVVELRADVITIDNPGASAMCAGSTSVALLDARGGRGGNGCGGGGGGGGGALLVRAGAVLNVDGNWYSVIGGGSGGGNCEAGGGGGGGRVRVDLPSSQSLPIAGGGQPPPRRGPMWSPDVPVVVTGAPSISPDLFGQAARTYPVRVGTSEMGSVTIDTETGQATAPVTLSPGRNRLCALVSTDPDLDLSLPEATNCIDIAYIP